jgi:hypothetical protein
MVRRQVARATLVARGSVASIVVFVSSTLVGQCGTPLALLAIVAARRHLCVSALRAASRTWGCTSLVAEGKRRTPLVAMVRRRRRTKRRRAIARRRNGAHVDRAAANVALVHGGGGTPRLRGASVDDVGNADVGTACGGAM